MRNKTIAWITAIETFLMISFATMPIATAAGSITLTPSAQAPGASVTVAGTGFGTTKNVAIGFGAEISGNDSNIAYSGAGVGPWSGKVSNYPIKPGTFVLTSVVVATGSIAIHTDNGDGTLSSPSQFFESGTINYATGQWTTIATIDISSFERVYNASYTRYQYNATPAAGVATSASGAFTASITVPAVANGNYNVTSIDTQGNWAVASLSVSSTIPEGITLGVMLLLSSVAVIAGAHYFRRPRIEKRI